MKMKMMALAPAPTITALTHLAGVINGIDYPREGLTPERMGLAGKTAAQIRAHAGAPTGAPATTSCRQVRDHPHHAESARSTPATAI